MSDLTALSPRAAAAVIQDMTAELTRLRALLQDIEWNGGLFEPHRGMVPCCPYCGRERVEGHNAVCRLNTALGVKHE